MNIQNTISINQVSLNDKIKKNIICKINFFTNRSRLCLFQRINLYIKLHGKNFIPLETTEKERK